MKIEEISGIEDFVKESEKIDENKSREVYKVDGRAFVVANKNTIEVRTD